MSEEELREKIIKGLECCAVGAECDHCPYSPMNKSGHEGCYQMHADAFALLKAQEPRVMTPEEARNVEVVWVEDRSTREIYPCIVKNNMNDSKLYKYGVQWRCWTAKPTEEQRKAVKWE